ncbi:MAG: ABC transporter ATP-binding protein [Arenicellales bacterium]|jgi:branched-chain amino acid transport system ATP-binding protein|nr:ABC transporter ATP-binding protein [Arenicellales bacterium]|tara:strand:- start:1846 stop:2733 length:888 start_codon:yes stop_codon:yes gene_type:complete
MLDCRDLSVFYGPHLALAGVSINIKPGEIVAILGANGAGKSTLLKTICGLIDYEDESEICIHGRSISDWDPHHIVEAGLSRVPEGRDLFGELTVLENLMLGAYSQRARGKEEANLDQVMTLFPKLAERRSQIAHTMSGGEQQMVAVGRAMMAAPSILMLDEPSLGLSPLLCAELFRALAEIRKSGVGVLLVEQNVKQSLAICDRAYLLETGRITGEGSAEALANDQMVLRAYLGGITRLQRQRPERLPTREILQSNVHDLVKGAEQRQSDHITAMRMGPGALTIDKGDRDEKDID